MTTTSLYSLTAILAFVMSYGIVEVIRRYGTKLRLVQVPNQRSSHVNPTVSGGGLGIALAGTISAIALGQASPPAFQIAIGVSVIGSIIGLMDDRFDLSARLRILGHFLLVATLILSSGMIPLSDLQSFSVVSLMYFFALLIGGVWWINLFNFMDGIDGIAASEAIFILGAAATFLVNSTVGEEWSALPVMVAVIAASLGFLLHNWPPARIFMGDAGSNYLAFFILAMAFITVANATIRPSAWIILTAAFAADATVTLLRRMLHGEKWLSAHRLHAYQKLSRRWNG